MPPRSALHTLPEAVRDDLNARLVAGGFGGYVALAEWLQAQGYQISKSALHRYGAALETDFNEAMADVRRANELGRAMMGDDDGAGLRRSLTAMASETVLRLQLRLRKLEASLEDGADPAHLARAVSLLSRASADLGRLGLADAKYAQTIERVAAQVEAEGGQATPERLRAIAREIYGV